MLFIIRTNLSMFNKECWGLAGNVRRYSSNFHFLSYSAHSILVYSLFCELLDIQVLDLLEDACESLLDSIIQSQNAPTSATP
jgi:hypothetical protein